MYSVIASDGRRPDLIVDCIRSLASCKRPASYNGLILIENSPQQQLQDAVAQCRDLLPIEYLFIPTSNKSAALNLAIEQAGDALLYFHDDDLTFGANCLVAMDAAAKKFPVDSFFTGPLRVRYDEEPVDWLREYLPRSAQGWKLEFATVTKLANHPGLGGNWAARSRDLKRINGFSVRVGPSFSAIGEDSLAQEQLRRVGAEPYYVPEAECCHYVPVERCSPDWALTRTYRSHIIKGMSLDKRSLPDRLLRLAKKCARLAITWVEYVCYSVTGRAREAFDARFRLAQTRGVIEGLLCGDPLK